MTYTIKTLQQHLANDGTSKRILALDGGGLRGILTVGILKKIEDVLRERHGNSEEFRLSHYFDLIAGTSTGAIIAAALSLDWKVDEIEEKYFDLGKKVFKKSFLKKGFIRAKYDKDLLSSELKQVFSANSDGKQVSMGSDEIATGLLIVTKRMDTGSPWPISNNPRGKYYESREKGVIGNKDYPLWQVVRASTAAPSFFESEEITIAEQTGSKSVVGNFVDGGVSPYNNPALQALMYCTLDGYRIDWPTGANKILLVSIGTGRADPGVKKSFLGLEGIDALKGLVTLMDDSAALQETILQWLSHSPTAKMIDSEVGDLKHDLVGPSPMLSYLRYDGDLNEDAVTAIYPRHLKKETIQSLTSMDNPANMKILHRIGELTADRKISAGDFPSVFDLTG